MPRSSSGRRASRARRLPLAIAAVAVATLAVAAGVVWFVHGRTPVLVVEDVKRQRVLHREPVRPGQAFTLSYVHSSEHVPVRGVFRVEADRTLTVTETAFAGFGPGLPTLGPADAWRIADGMIVAAGPLTRLPELRVRVAPFTQHRLRAPSGAEMDLSALGEGGATVRISVR